MDVCVCPYIYNWQEQIWRIHITYELCALSSLVKYCQLGCQGTYWLVSQVWQFQDAYISNTFLCDSLLCIHKFHWFSQSQRVIHLLVFPTVWNGHPHGNQTFGIPMKGIFKVLPSDQHRATLVKTSPVGQWLQWQWLVTQTCRSLLHVGGASLPWTLTNTIRPQFHWGTRCTGTGITPRGTAVLHPAG